MPLRLSLPVVYCSLLLFAELVLAKLTPVPLIHGRDGPLVAHDGSTRTGEGPKSRIVVVVVMLFCMFLLAGSLGTITFPRPYLSFYRHNWLTWSQAFDSKSWTGVG